MQSDRWSAGEHVPERFRGMLGPTTGQVIDLLSARDSRRHDLGGGGLGLHSRHQSPVAHGDRDIVVLFLEAEGAGHPAAARIDLGDLEAGPTKNRDRGSRAHDRLLVTVPVQKSPPTMLPEAQVEPARALANEKLFEQETG